MICLLFLLHIFRMPVQVSCLAVPLVEICLDRDYTIVPLDVFHQKAARPGEYHKRGQSRSLQVVAKPLHIQMNPSYANGTIDISSTSS